MEVEFQHVTFTITPKIIINIISKQKGCAVNVLKKASVVTLRGTQSTKTNLGGLQQCNPPTLIVY